MFKHPYCGGQHETVGQARNCEAANTPEVAAGARAIRESQSVEEVWPWATDAKTERPAQKRFEDRNRTKGDAKKYARPFTMGIAYAQALRDGTAPAPVEEPAFVAPPQNHFQAAIASEWDAPTTPSCSGRNSEGTRRGYGQATEGMERFVRILLEERDWEHAIDPQSANGEAISDLGNGLPISFPAARLLIELLKTLPKHGAQAAPATSAPKNVQPWKTLSEKVPAGYYGLQDQDGKNHFYRVSVGRNGFFKIQEQASSDLYFIPLLRYAVILEAILAYGLDKAGKFYATETSRCRKCNRVLTDNTGNPYFEMGYGPDCGGK
jgi:hypothetical protein